MRSNPLEFTPALMLAEDEAAAGLEILDRAPGDVARGRVGDEAAAAFAGW